MSVPTLSEFVEASRSEHGIPGAAVGVSLAGHVSTACSGVTSVENPLSVDEDTLFTLGSVTKVTTATAVMRLVSEGRVNLGDRVRLHIPEFSLSDQRIAGMITIRELLNHTAGLGLGEIVESDEADDALARYVAGMVELELVGRPGVRASYSQAGFDLLGRVVEKVTGRTYERAVQSLVFDPLGMTHSAYLSRDLLSRRYSVGHNRKDDGSLVPARLRKRDRGDNPGGGLDSSLSDQLRLAQFHLNDGKNVDGTQLVAVKDIRSMRQHTTDLRGSSLGDAIGLCWFLRHLDGVQLVGHGGSTNGQFAEMLLVPELDFAVVSLCNAGPEGIPFNQDVLRWVLQQYLDLHEQDPEPVPYDGRRAAEMVGRYDVDAMSLLIETDGARLTVAALIKPEIRSSAATELPPDHPAATLGLLPGAGDEYVISDGGLRGQRGFFTRNGNGEIIGADLAGRYFSRVDIT